ncbi:MAG: Pvc16 family protein [Solirubrobacteraceae bacterium]
MALTIQVPLNTMFSDLDESLRALLKRELERHGFEGVQIAFDAPARDWSSALTTPCVDLFLYDVREAKDLRDRTWREERGNGAARMDRPPLRIECSYAVTAWTRVVEDEHRLLSQVLAILNAFQELPRETLAGALADPGSQRFAITSRIGVPSGDGRADFWSAVGGQYKVSLDYIVTLACEPGVAVQGGPEVRTQTLRVGDRDLTSSRSFEELHRSGGIVRDPEGRPLANVWVALPDAGAFTATGPDGRFAFERVNAGRHRCVVRADDGTEAEQELVVPGLGVEIELGIATPTS